MKGHTYISNSVDEKGYVSWSDEENETWATLIKRQNEIIKGRACKQFEKGLEILDFPKDKVPQIPEINEKLNKETGWAVHPVDAVIPPLEFFTLLANKKFPAATFIRIPAEIDYIQEPDIFHEIYGHAPLLTHKPYADFLEQFGKLALKLDSKYRFRLFRLFWFTIEFGLINTDEGLRAYGGGILSSIGETQFCLSGVPKIMEFTPMDSLRTSYRIDIMQPLYFTINKLEDLYPILELDIPELLIESKKLGDYSPLYSPADDSEAISEKGAMKC